MTCSQDCKNCIYGIPKYTMRCGDKNITCNGECNKCPYRIIISTNYICGRFQYD